MTADYDPEVSKIEDKSSAENRLKFHEFHAETANNKSV